MRVGRIRFPRSAELKLRASFEVGIRHPARSRLCRQLPRGRASFCSAGSRKHDCTGPNLPITSRHGDKGQACQNSCSDRSDRAAMRMWRPACAAMSCIMSPSRHRRAARSPEQAPQRGCPITRRYGSKITRFGRARRANARALHLCCGRPKPDFPRFAPLWERRCMTDEDRAGRINALGYEARHFAHKHRISADGERTDRAFRPVSRQARCCRARLESGHRERRMIPAPSAC